MRKSDARPISVIQSRETKKGKAIKIDFVSDVSCPWCVIGLRGLEEALALIGDEVEADITFRPFELNPAMPLEGQNIVEHIGQKYDRRRTSRRPIGR